MPALCLGLAGCAASGVPVSSIELDRSALAPSRSSESSPRPRAEVVSVQAPEAGQPELRDEDLPKGEAIPVDGSARVRGRATMIVNAPLEKARHIVLDFERYPEFMPGFSGSKVLGRVHGAWDLYQEMSVLHGTIRMWARIKVPKPTVVDGVETYAGEFVEGNVITYEPRWKLRPVDGTRTEMTVELFLEPKFFMPDSWLNQKNVESATRAVLAMKQRIEHLP